MSNISEKTPYPQNIDSFKRLVESFKQTDRYKEPLLFAIGGVICTFNRTLASMRYPFVNGPGQNTGMAAILMMVLDIPPEGVQSATLTEWHLQEILRYFTPFENDSTRHLNIELLKRALQKQQDVLTDCCEATFIFDDIAPQGVKDSTLKLYALSNRIFKPNTLNLTKIFTKLPNVAWMGDTPFDSSEIDGLLFDAMFEDAIYAPHMVDKFPLYIHRINAVKMGVRITDQHKVRLGAYLGEGTTLMPGASYINFNAGTDGEAIVEGRISSSAFVGTGSDIGGGASILGTLSGGNAVPISIGQNCLLEVNSALGIPIGDAVIIAAETAVMASSKVYVDIYEHPLYGQTVKASSLAGIDAVTFRRNDVSGRLEIVETPRNAAFMEKVKNRQTILNAELHDNS
jgi:2,3,4,5-tetrahydropyridine-2-carboxylate N-succinyltransferase